MTAFNAQINVECLYELQSLPIWTKVLRFRIERRHSRLDRRYITARESCFLLNEFIGCRLARHRMHGSYWAFAGECQSHLQRLLAVQGIAIGRYDSPKTKDRAEGFVVFDRKARQLASSSMNRRRTMSIDK